MTRPIAARASGFALLSVFLLALCGCGPSTATVTGKVSYNGKVVKGGTVSFTSAEGLGAVSGPILDDGTYKVERVPAGAAKVCVDTEGFNPAKKAKVPKYGPPAGQEGPSGFGSDDSEANAKRYMKIPQSYANPETTPLSYTVPSGSGTYDIEIK